MSSKRTFGLVGDYGGDSSDDESGAVNENKDSRCRQRNKQTSTYIANKEFEILKTLKSDLHWKPTSGQTI